MICPKCGRYMIYMCRRIINEIEYSVFYCPPPCGHEELVHYFVGG